MDFRRLRYEMVEGQIAARGILDENVLEVLRRIPRHAFVPEEAIDKAYQDCPIPIGEGQTISQPYMVALMTQCLDLNKNKQVMEIGTGSGYQTAVLSELSKKVCSIERIEVLAHRARKKLQEFNYTNIKIYIGDGTLGWPDASQLFDAIIITAASPGRLDHLFSQLAPDGRIVAPLGDRFSQTLKLFTKVKGHIVEESVCACTFVPLIGVYGWST